MQEPIEFLFADELEIEQLYYDCEENVMFDADGYIVFDIFRLITPSQLQIFKEGQTWMMVQGKNGLAIELIYPDSPGNYMW